MTNKQKWETTTNLLRTEWRQWSDRAIAKQANVSPAFVAKVRKQLREQEKNNV